MKYGIKGNDISAKNTQKINFTSMTLNKYFMYLDRKFNFIKTRD